MKIIMRVLGKPGRQYDEIEFDTDSLPFTYEAENGKVRISRASKTEESPGTVPAVAAANSQSVTALSEIVWDWLTENAVDVMVDECDVNILIQRLNAGVPALHT